MNKHGVLLLIVMAASLQAAAQFTTTAHSARNSAMGGCLLLQADSGAHLSIGWRQGYLAQGMSTRHLAADAQLGTSGHAYGTYSHFGDATYHEQQAALAYAIRASQWLNIGVYGTYSHIGTNDSHYDSHQWLDGGVMIQASDNMHIAGYLAAGSRSWDEQQRFGVRAGFAYKPARSITTVVEYALEERARVRCGIEYVYENHYYARAGLFTNPVTMTFGLGLAQRHYTIDLGTEVHPILGLSPQISLGLCL